MFASQKTISFTLILVLLALVLLLVSVPQAARAAVLVGENFEDNAANGFGTEIGSFSIVTDGSQVYSTSSATARSYVGNVTWADYAVEGKVKVAAWSSATSYTAGLLGRYTDSNNYYLFVYELGQLRLKKKAGGTITTLASKNYTFGLNTWYTFKGEMTGSSLKFYVNGTQELTATDAALATGKAGVISIAGNAAHFDDLTVTGVASAYDAAVLADNPVGYWPIATGVTADQSGHGNNGTFTGSPTAASLPNGEAAVAFNGTNQYFTIPDDSDLEIATTGMLTVEAWMRPDVLAFPDYEGSGYVHWMGKGTSGNQSWVARMYNLTNTENRPNRISGYSFNLTGGLGAGSYFQDPVTAGQWIHYALVINTVNTSATYPTGYTKIYKNGVLRDQDSLSGYSIVPGDGNAPMRIGTRDLSSYFQGAIGKVALYDYELTPTRLVGHYDEMMP